MRSEKVNNSYTIGPVKEVTNLLLDAGHEKRRYLRPISGNITSWLQDGCGDAVDDVGKAIGR